MLYRDIYYSEEQLQQVSLVDEKLAALRLCSAKIAEGKDVPDSEIKELTKDVLDNIVPMAERLGMHHEQQEMQDTCIRLAYPEDYKKLKKLLSDSEAMCEIVFKTFAIPLKAMIADLGIEFTMQYRMKSVYSIWRKMKIDHKNFDDVYDLFAARIIYKSPQQEPKSLNPLYNEVRDLRQMGGSRGYINFEQLYCWRIYNVIAMLYRIHPDRIKNWITHPKPSGYQALQLTVMGPDCNWIEVQIRSERMDYEAEHGKAAHWKYKAETAEKASNAFS